GAPAAAGSPPVKATAKAARAEGALSGMPIDDSLKADIFAELGGKPDPVESDTEENEEEVEPTAKSASPGASEETTEEESEETEDAETEETSDDQAGDETDESAEVSDEVADEAAAETAAEAKADDDLPAGLKKELFNLREEIRQLRREKETASA